MLVNESFSIEQEVTTQKEANELMYKLISQAGTLVSNAQCVADQFGLTFNLDIGGYGMGGTYIGEGTDEFPMEGWRASSAGEWQASSQSC